ncbi:putative T7SS-secreted protein [Streptomyces sp. G-G2]|uniref:putative T7SS-secreted protein n=1 Tax=Streptomyces sp. G-G2 TaxID=3046201 RepID=UPI0024B8A633|nr:RHS repeat-associated core domain-containing protein [Streptomyces sp. G-G2]MDJ0383749.1 RHS repeat-associated core domain-containing protein [Streptomyces sp. G-G2]
MGLGDFIPDPVEDWFEDRTEDVGDAIEWTGDKVAGLADKVGLDDAGDWIRDKSRSAANQLGADVSEMELGQTDDPRKLVYGSVSKIRAQISHLSDFERSFTLVGNGLKGMTDPDGLKGKTADAFRETVAKEPPQWFKAAESFGKAADAMARFAETVEWAQGQAKEALEAYDHAKKVSTDARNAHNKLVDTYNDALKAKKDPLPSRPSEDFTDPGPALATAAQDKLDGARKQRNEVAETVRTAVRAARDAAPPKPSYAKQFGDGMDYLDLAKTHLSGGVIKGAADMVDFARSLNPTDPYNLTHPAEYATQLNSTAAGLVTAVNDPWGAGKQMLDEFMKDPSEGIGKLIPQLLADKGLGEIGAGAKGARDLEHLDDGKKGPGRTGLGERGPHPDERPDLEKPSKYTDPVDLATGRMYLPQTDVVLPGTLPLVFTRRAESGYTAGRWFGPTWASTIDQHLEIDAEGVVLVTQDGLVVGYPHPAPGLAVLPVSASAPPHPLERTPDGDWTLTDPATGHVRRFALMADGRYGDAYGYGQGPEQARDRTSDHASDHAYGLAAITQLEDRNSNLITFEYDAHGTPLGITHSGGQHLRFETADGRITALHLAGGPRILAYGYTEGHLTEITNSSGLPLRLTYDDRARITSWTDTNGSRYAYAYDELDRCVAEAGEAGHIALTFGYDEVDATTGLRMTRMTTAEGHTRRYLFDARYRVVAETDPLGAVTRYAYDGRGRPTSSTDPLGRTTHSTYDDRGLLVSVIRPDGREARAEYDELGCPVKVIAPDGSVVRQTYDGRGNRTSVTRADGSVTRIAYDELGHITAVTDPLGAVTRVRTDRAGLPVAVTGRLGATTTYERDAFGRTTAVRDPLGAVTRTRWSVEGKPLHRSAPGGDDRSWTYDGEGNCLTRADGPSGGPVRFEYTHFDAVSARTDADGSRHEYTYDAGLRLTGVRNPQGLTWEYVYDAAGQLVAETDFDGRTLRYEYDAAGQLLSRGDALGQVVTYERDALGRPVRKDAAGTVTTYEYDVFDQLAVAVRGDCVLTRLRDRTGRLLEEAVDGRRLVHAYDAAGRRAGRTTPTGATAAWSFDAAGRPDALTTAGRRIGFAHDAAGRELTRTYGDVVTLSSGWDAAGRLTGQLLTGAGESVLQRRGYTYRDDGVLTGIDDLLAGPRTFDLDPRGRVTAVHAENWTERYAYDEAGNQASASWPGSHPGGQDATGPRAYAGTRLLTAGRVRHEYDALGRVVLRQKARLSRKPDTWRYEWDADDRITAVTTPDGTRWRYAYDALGRRTAKERMTADGLEVAERTVFTWDGNLLCEQTTTTAEGANGIAVTWDHRGLRPLAQTERILTASQEVVDERFYAIVTDLVGAPTELVDERGALAWRGRSTLWGSTAWSRDSTAYTPLRFPGQYFDPESGLHYNYFRSYDPETARYLSPDPLGLAPAQNPSAYVSNPHQWCDPFGLAPYSDSTRTAQGVDHQLNEAESGKANHYLSGIGADEAKLEKYLNGQLRAPANYVDDVSGARIIIDRGLRDGAGNPVVIIRQDHMIHAYHIEEKDLSNYITPRDGKDAAKWRTPNPDEVNE